MKLFDLVCAERDDKPLMCVVYCICRELLNNNTTVDNGKKSTAPLDSAVFFMSSDVSKY